MALGWDEPRGWAVAQWGDSGAWEREEPQALWIDEVMGPETGGLMGGHKKGCVRRQQLGLLGVAGPAWLRE